MFCHTCIRICLFTCCSPVYAVRLLFLCREKGEGYNSATRFYLLILVLRAVFKRSSVQDLVASSAEVADGNQLNTPRLTLLHGGCYPLSENMSKRCPFSVKKTSTGKPGWKFFRRLFNVLQKIKLMQCNFRHLFNFSYRRLKNLFWFKIKRFNDGQPSVRTNATP